MLFIQGQKGSSCEELNPFLQCFIPVTAPEHLHFPLGTEGDTWDFSFLQLSEHWPGILCVYDSCAESLWDLGLILFSSTARINISEDFACF